MAEWSMRVLFQANYGTTYRKASEAERQLADEALTALWNKWKAAGIRYIAYYACALPGGGSGVDFCHNAAFEVQDYARVYRMSHDVWASEWSKHVDGYNLTVVEGSSEMDAFWQSP